ncbi:hypothetical protein NDN08_004841 [Rhodosorus marinus]|uniref:Dihydrolipoamide acetyltransferase component of pyruvate dehydrogenase complex n=1 Tax=Rhodosorus marinus TaxID=101924 RepID=A0AAV8UMH7_9RHOD|nr:hypothetical protein NDN08_004841 [Rhodosorus marinus]
MASVISGRLQTARLLGSVRRSFAHTEILNKWGSTYCGNACGGGRHGSRWLSSAKPSFTVVEMPKLSPTMETGNIVSWMKKEGEHIAEGDAIAEIETDKATLTMDAQDECYMAKILVAEGTTDIEIGRPIAVSVEEAKDVEAVAAMEDSLFGGAIQEVTPVMTVTEAISEQSTPPSEPPHSASYPEHTVLEMPKLSPTMETGVISEWTKAEGDEIKSGDVIASVETDKATIDFEVHEDGYLAKILVEAGKPDIAIGQPVAIMTETPVETAVFEGYQKEGVQAVEQVTEQAPSAIPAIEEQSASATVAPPTKAEVETVKAPSSITPAWEGSYEDIELTKYRRITGARLVESKLSIPHYYLSVTCCVDQMSEMRARINDNRKDGEPKVSVNDFVLKACAVALRKVPEVNSQWAGESIRQMHAVDLSVAVQTERGLITPIVPDADRKTLKEMSAKVRELAQKAKENTLLPAEFMGGTFTVSNLGMFGVDEFSAVINPPQSAILAVGTGHQKVVPNGEGGFTNSQFMTVTLSCDHRVVDGALGSRWLACFQENIEDPINML